MEKTNRLDGIWGNGAFKVKIKGSAYVSFYNNSRYGKGTITYESENFVLTSSHARCIIFWTPFIEIVKGKFINTDDGLSVSEIEGRYSDYNGTWVRLKNKHCSFNAVGAKVVPAGASKLAAPTVAERAAGIKHGARFRLLKDDST